MTEARDHYPIVIVEDRYNGVYAGGPWLAISVGDHLENGAYRVVRCLEQGPHGDDFEAQDFWADAPSWIAVGRTPDEAAVHLREGHTGTLNLKAVAFFRRLDEAQPGRSAHLKTFMARLRRLGIQPEFQKSAVLRWYPRPELVGSVGYVDPWGTVYVGDAAGTCAKIGLDAAATVYLQTVANSVGGSVRTYNTATPTVLGPDGKELKVDALLDRAADWERAIETLVQAASPQTTSP